MSSRGSVYGISTTEAGHAKNKTSFDDISHLETREARAHIRQNNLNSIFSSMIIQVTNERPCHFKSIQ